MQIVHTNDRNVAQAYCDRGFEPIECSFGTAGSVVGPLKMDHHGDFSSLEGVAIRAYRDHFGARKDDPRFVVTGAADEDATFASAALAGILPSDHCLTGLAKIIDRMDVNPIGFRPEETDDGCLYLLWGQMSSNVQDETAFYAGIDRWRALISRPPVALLAAVKAEEQNRVAKARAAKVTRAGAYVTLVESPEWGFDVWYSDFTPVILAWNPDDGSVTVGCPNVETAEDLFGKGGLKNVFPGLDPTGWGGREAIGGSPRGLNLPFEDALKAAFDIAFRLTVKP